MTEAAARRPAPRATAFMLIKATALDEVARHGGGGPPRANWEMHDGLTAALESWRAAGALREESLLLTEWLAVELCGFVFLQLDEDRGRLGRWLRDFGNQVCRSQQHSHPAGPTAIEILSVVADELADRRPGAAGADRLARIGPPYRLYLRAGHELEDARELTLTLALWAGSQLAALMRHEAERITSYMAARDRAQPLP